MRMSPVRQLSPALPPCLPPIQSRQAASTSNDMEQPLLLLRRPQPPRPTMLKHEDNSTSRLLIPSRNPKEASIRFDEDGEESTSSRRRRRCSPSDVLRLMDALHVPVDTEIYISLAKECTRSRNAVEAAALRAHIPMNIAARPDAILLLGNRLLLMHAACSMYSEARQLFSQMATTTGRDAGSFAAMIAAMMVNKEGSQAHREACELFVEMLVQGGDAATNMTMKMKNNTGRSHYVQLVLEAAALVRKSCIRWGDVELAQQIHGLILKIHMIGLPSSSHY